MEYNLENREVAVKLTGVKKMYKLGQIGGGTLHGDLESWWARVRGKEDPNTIVGTNQRLAGQTFMALNGIDMTIYKGEAVGIIGGNGAGKSTMLKLLSRVTAPTEGEIDIYGRIASMLEVGTGFHGELTGRENVYMNGAILGMTKAEIDAKMEDIIEFSEVRDFIDTPVKRYSSGMYVKLAFPVAAHLVSEIMIMDEVQAVGDMAFQKKCLNKMKDAAKKEGRTVLYVSHNMNTIRQLCDRCIVLDKGRVVFEGNVEAAIALYMESSCSFQNHYDFSTCHLQTERNVGSFRMESLDILGEEGTHVSPNGTIHMNLLCTSSRVWENVKFRFEIKFIDGMVCATGLTDRPIDFTGTGQQNVKLAFCTKHLTPGKYIADLVAYIYDSVGNEQLLDGVYPGFAFEVDDLVDQENQLMWQHQHWGHVRLHDVQVQE